VPLYRRGEVGNRRLPARKSAPSSALAECTFAHS